jgi:hypothetical protein
LNRIEEQPFAISKKFLGLVQNPFRRMYRSTAINYDLLTV